MKQMIMFWYFYGCRIAVGFNKTRKSYVNMNSPIIDKKKEGKNEGNHVLYVDTK